MVSLRSSKPPTSSKVTLVFTPKGSASASATKKNAVSTDEGKLKNSNRNFTRISNLSKIRRCPASCQIAGHHSTSSSTGNRPSKRRKSTKRLARCPRRMIRVLKQQQHQQPIQKLKKRPPIQNHLHPSPSTVPAQPQTHSIQDLGPSQTFHDVARSSHSVHQPV